MTIEHRAPRQGPLARHLPEHWPDGPTDEVLGELFYAALRIQHDTDDMVKGNGAYARLIGSFDMRALAMQAAPYVASVLFHGESRVVAHRLRQILGVDARGILESVAAYIPHGPERGDDE